MNHSVLDKNAVFKGHPAKELWKHLEATPHQVRCFAKDETIFHLMDDAARIGLILEGRVQAQKPFPNGSQVNVSVRMPGDLVGLAVVFSPNHKYPCNIVALEPVTMMMFQKEDLLSLMQRDLRILESFMAELASTAYMLQQRLEMSSYHGIAQKAAFYLLMQSKQNGENHIMIPESVSKWAMTMNVSRPSLHRELKRLEADGIISYSPPIIEIHDPDALQKLLCKQPKQHRA